MNCSFLSEEKLASLGILDEVYSIYIKINDNYNEAFECYKKDIPNEFSRLNRLDSLLKDDIQNIFNSFLSKYSYLFYSENKTLKVNNKDTFVYHHYNFKHVSQYTLKVTPISFNEFLFFLERSIVLAALEAERVRLDKPKLVYEYMNSRSADCFNSYVKEAQTKTGICSVANKAQIKDIIVFKSLSSISCNLKCHSIQSAIIEVPLLDQNFNVQLPVHICNTCGRIFIGNETLKLYEGKYGQMVIRKREDTVYGNTYDIYSNESKLHSLGYNVVAGKLTEKERRSILTNLYDKEVLTLFEIQRDLEAAIRIFEYQSRYSTAVKKWKSDLFFISEYAKEHKDK